LGATLTLVKRLATRASMTYLFFALLGRFMERIGVFGCECEPTCWCKRRGLSLFRWVVPNRRHHLRGPIVG
jgi:hypothetical protein